MEHTLLSKDEDPNHITSLSSDTLTSGTNKGNNSTYVKQKVAVVFGYVGEKYSGLQYNYDPRHPTIEAELMKAFHRAGLVSEANMASPKEMMNKVQFERASRTDKGVHALKNICSLKIQVPKFIDGEGINTSSSNNGEINNDNRSLSQLFAKKDKVDAIMHEVTMKINKHLPTEDILVYKVHPVTGSFNSYSVCMGRRYQYYLPTFALANKNEFDELIPIELGPEFVSDETYGLGSEKQTITTTTSSSDDVNAGKKRSRSDREKRCEEHAGDDELARERMKLFKEIPQSVMKKIAKYRINDENLNRARELFKIYEGTKSFHNFTPAGSSNDPSTIRFMKKITINSPELIIPSLEKPSLSHLDSIYYTPKVNECHAKVTEELAEESFSDGNRDHSSASKVNRKIETSEACNKLNISKFSLPETLDTTIAVNSYVDDATNIEKKKENEQHINETYSDGIEWVRIEIEGQSFMLNQIRKMVGLVISCMTLGLPNEFVHYCLNPRIRIGIPTAPANGLFLSFLDIERYNSRLIRIKTQEGISTEKEPLDIEGESKSLGKEELKDLLRRKGILPMSNDLQTGNEGHSTDAKDDELIGAALIRYEEERGALSAAVEAMHKRIVSTVCRKEACEDITGRWMRSLRQVARLCFRLSFSKGVRYVAQHEERLQDENISKYTECVDSESSVLDRELVICFNVLINKFVPSIPLTWDKYVTICASGKEVNGNGNSTTE